MVDQNPPNIDRVEELICSQEDAETHHRTRQIAAELNISERSVRCIAREDLRLTSFRRVPVQIISDAVRQKRLERATAMLRRFKVQKPSCLARVNGYVPSRRSSLSALLDARYCYLRPSLFLVLP